MSTIQCVLVLLAGVVCVAPQDMMTGPLERDDVIDAVNSAKTTWTAGRNFDPSMTKGHVKILLGGRTPPDGSRLPAYVPGERVKNMTDNLELPCAYDARTEYSYCSALQTLRDQGPCGSCWATAVASAFTDRLCIASRGSWNSQLSAQYLLSCCTTCGNCGDGGYTNLAWEYAESNGLCTGGDYMSDVGCQPFSLPACEHHVNGSREDCDIFDDTFTPACQPDSCTNENYATAFRKDFHKVSSTFSLNNVEKAMWEIYINGPVVASFAAYEDFLSYQSGVYQYTTGVYLGGHAVKVFGWGVEDGTKYWLAANSWNNDWGDSGFFKIIRGTDDCGFEDRMTGGLPVVD